MKIFIDFDDVIFNTKKFIADWIAVFKTNGISEDVYWRNYRSDEIYNPKGHIKRIKTEINFNKKKLEDSLEKVIISARKYIFNDV